MPGFGERLVEAVQRKRTPALVGLDPRPDLLPASLLARYGLGSPLVHCSCGVWARAIEEFCSRALDVVAPHVPAVKFQSAFYELHGAPGIEALRSLVRKARRLGLVTIFDAKRGDIGSTSEAYAQAAFGLSTKPVFTTSASALGDADAITVSPYLGRDSLDPFLEYARRDRGVFVLVRTSNPGAADLQHLSAGSAARPIYAYVADWIHQWSDTTRGGAAYGSIGAVVGGTAPEQIAELRQAMPHAILLVPGYGTQGAKGADIAAAFDDRGHGALVNNSRGVLFPGGQADAKTDWESAIERAVRTMIDDLAAHTPAGRLR